MVLPASTVITVYVTWQIGLFHLLNCISGDSYSYSLSGLKIANKAL